MIPLRFDSQFWYLWSRFWVTTRAGAVIQSLKLRQTWWGVTAMLTINRRLPFLWYKMRSFWEGKKYSKNTTSPLNLCYILNRGLDLSILKIWGLLVKVLQSYQLSKLEFTRKSLPTGPGPTRISRPRFEPGHLQIILKVWLPAILQPFDLQTPNFQHWKI